MLIIAQFLFLQPSFFGIYHFPLKFYTIFFCILGICTDLSKSNHSLPNSTHFCLEIFINSITSYQFLSMMRLFFIFLMLEFVSLLTKLCNCTLLFCILRRLYKSYHSLLNSTTLFCILKICFKTNLFKSLYIRFYMSVIASNLYKSYHFLPNSTRFLFAFLIFIQIIPPFYTLRLAQIYPNLTLDSAYAFDLVNLSKTLLRSKRRNIFHFISLSIVLRIELVLFQKIFNFLQS